MYHQVVHTSHLCVLYGSQNTHQLLPYVNRLVERFLSVRTVSLYKADTFRLEMIKWLRHFVYTEALKQKTISLREFGHFTLNNKWLSHFTIFEVSKWKFYHRTVLVINSLNPELNPIYLLALLGAHHFLHVSRIRVKLLTFRRLMSYIYIYIYIWSTHSWCF